jgi:polysaccharide biosynthesis/export protein
LKNHLITICLVLTVFASCRTTKTVNYFSNPTNDSSHTYIYQSFEVPIQVGDQLSIVVSALNPSSAAPYNLPGMASGGPLGSGGSISGGASKGITVEQDGRIMYPQLGYVKAEGLTRSQLRDLLVTRLKTYLTDPVVSVDFINFKVSVIGEVGRPGILTSPDGKLNILEALAQSGDLTRYAEKSPVMIIRENKGRREFGYVSLLSKSIFSSPYYRLQQNDVIYVRSIENKPTVEEETSARKLSYIATIVSLVSTLSFLIYTLIVR